MRVLRNATASLTTLLSLGGLYLVVVVLTILLSNRIIARPDLLDGVFFRLVIAIAVLVPIALLGVVGYSILRLARERRRGGVGSALKGRLTLFFALVVVFAAVPQAVVSVSFLSSGLSILFASGTGEALEDGLSIAIARYERLVYDLGMLGSDGTVAGLLGVPESEVDAEGASQIAASPDDRLEAAWPRLVAREPEIAAVQLFDRDGVPQARMGARDLFLLSAPARGTNLPSTGTVTRTTRGGDSLLELAVPLDGGRGGFAIVSSRLPAGLDVGARRLTEAIELFAGLEALRPTFLLVVALVYGIFISPVLLLTVLASFFFADRIMRPIDSLEDATRRVTEGDYSVRILARPSDDLGLLVQSFNRMVNELDRTRRRAMQAEKVQAWQEIAQRLAHEVKNPLTPIRLAAERLRRRYEAGDPAFGEVLERTVTTIVREVEELTALLNEFRSFSRLPEPHRETAALRAIVEDAVAVYRDDAAVEVDLSEVSDALVVDVDRGQIRQVLSNLLANAVEASMADTATDGPASTPADGHLVVRIAASEVLHADRRWCRVTVEDNGPGIPDEVLGSLFEPYVTTKRSGTGLGLAIVERIIFDHDGRISCGTSAGGGATFVIELPLDERRGLGGPRPTSGGTGRHRRAGGETSATPAPGQE